MSDQTPITTDAPSAPGGDPAPQPTPPADPAQPPAPAGDPPAPILKAPEAYSFTAPEGGELNAEALALFEPLFRKADLSNEHAQEFVAAFAKDVIPQWEASLQQAQQTISTQWAESLKTDKEFGGANYSQNEHLAQSAIERFGGPELKTLLNETGFGNNPDLFRAFFRVGKAMAEDSLSTTGGQSAGHRSAAEILYGNGQ